MAYLVDIVWIVSKDLGSTALVLSAWTSKQLADSAVEYHRVKEGYNYVYRVTERKLNITGE